MKDMNIKIISKKVKLLSKIFTVILILKINKLQKIYLLSLDKVKLLVFSLVNKNKQMKILNKLKKYQKKEPYQQSLLLIQININSKLQKKR